MTSIHYPKFGAKCGKLDLFEIMANQSNQCTTCGKFDIKLDLVTEKVGIHRKYLTAEH